MIYNIEIYFMLFIIYAFLGWIMECILGLIQNHKFVNRGFLIGPYCPIYGVGVVIVTLLLSRFSNNIILLFISSTILCGILEYFTGYLMEKIFNARWWDYTDKKFNINGRVCLEYLLAFGVICVLVISFVNPWIFDKLYLIPKNILHILAGSLLIIYLIDTCISFKVILNFKNVTKQAKDNTEEISKKVKEATEAVIKKLTLEKDNLLRKMNIKTYSIIKDLKYTSVNYKNKIKIKNQEITLVGKFKARIEKIDDIIINSAKEMSEKIKSTQLRLSKEFKEKFVKQSKLNKRLISAFPNVEQREYTRKKK